MNFIPISNGILEGKHQAKMGMAVWQFMWLIDKVTKIDAEGFGHVLGGKPIQLKELRLSLSDKQASRHLQKLKKEGYITLLRTPYGFVIKVAHAKKIFKKQEKRVDISVSSETTKTERSDIESGHKCPADQTKVSETKKTIQDNTKEKNSPADADAKEIPEVIFAFKEVNPLNYNKWFNRPPQREPVRRLLHAHGKEKVLQVVGFLPKTNKIPYFPKIYTPLQLEEKWSVLEDAFIRKKAELQTNTKVIFSS